MNESPSLPHPPSPHSSDSSSLPQESSECRVCRLGSSPGQELYSPCLCRGSIEFIHQDCLLSWLKLKKKSHCELCGFEFQFQPVYAENAPKTPSAWDLFMGSFSKARTFIPYTLRLMMCIFGWLFLVPSVAAILWRACFHFSYSLSWSIFLKRYANYEIFHFWLDSQLGAIISIAILVISLLMVSLRELIREEQDIEQMMRQANEPGNPGEQQNQANPPVEDAQAAPAAPDQRRPVRNRFQLRDFRVNARDAAELVPVDGENDLEGELEALIDSEDEEDEEEEDEPWRDEQDEWDSEEEGDDELPEDFDEVDEPPPAPAAPGEAAAPVQLFDDNGNFAPAEFEDLPFQNWFGLAGPLRYFFVQIWGIVTYIAVFLFFLLFTPLNAGRALFWALEIDSREFSYSLCKLVAELLQGGGELPLAAAVAAATGGNSTTGEIPADLILSTAASLAGNSSTISSSASALPFAASSLFVLANSVTELTQLFPPTTLEALETLHSRLHCEEITILLIGYTVLLGFSVFFAYGIPWFSFLQSPVHHLLLSLKITLIMGCELLIFPLFLGIFMDFLTLFAFQVTISHRILYFQQNPLSAIISHWFFGILTMLFIHGFVSLLRKTLRRSVLGKFLRYPDENDFQPFQELIQESLSWHSRKLLKSGWNYCLFVFITFHIPLKIYEKISLGWNDYISPSYGGNLMIFPLEIRFSEADFLLFHFTLPILFLQKMEFRQFSLWCVRKWFLGVGKFLGIDEYLLPPLAGAAGGGAGAGGAAAAGPRPEDSQSIPHFRLRIFALFFFLWSTAVVNMGIFFLSPLLLGRAMMKWLQKEILENLELILIQNQTTKDSNGSGGVGGLLDYITGNWLTSSTTTAAMATATAAAGEAIAAASSASTAASSSKPAPLEFLQQDLYSFLLGVYLYLFFFYFLRQIFHNLRHGISSFFLSIWENALLVGKCIFLGIFLLFLIPFLYGFIFDLSLLQPYRYHYYEKSTFSYHQDYLWGLFICKGLYRLARLGVFNKMIAGGVGQENHGPALPLAGGVGGERENGPIAPVVGAAAAVAPANGNSYKEILETIRRDGWRRVHARFIFISLILPLLWEVFLLLIVPWTLARGIFPQIIEFLLNHSSSSSSSPSAIEEYSPFLQGIFLHSSQFLENSLQSLNISQFLSANSSFLWNSSEGGISSSSSLSSSSSSMPIEQEIRIEFIQSIVFRYIFFLFLLIRFLYLGISWFFHIFYWIQRESFEERWLVGKQLLNMGKYEENHQNPSSSSSSSSHGHRKEEEEEEEKIPPTGERMERNDSPSPQQQQQQRQKTHEEAEEFLSPEEIVANAMASVVDVEHSDPLEPLNGLRREAEEFVDEKPRFRSSGRITRSAAASVAERKTSADY